MTYEQHSEQNAQPARRTSVRMGVIGFGLVLFVSATSIRLVDVQLFQHATWLKASNAMVQRVETIPATRGGIYDRYGAILAVSGPTSKVIADTFLIKNPRRAARQLAPWLHVPVGPLAKTLATHKPGYGDLLLTDKMAVTDGRQLAQLNIDGISVSDFYHRASPNGTLARSLLGYVNSNGIGSAGLEYQFERTLAGVAGREEILKSVGRIAIPTAPVRVIQKAVPGQSLELTIDTALQYVTEYALAKQLAATKAYTGVAIVMDVRSGEILADASLVNHNVKPYPLPAVADWGNGGTVPGIRQTIMNLGMSQVYEPGSVFKIVPFSAALAAGTISPSTRFQVPFQIQVGTRPIHDAERHGLLNYSALDILTQSSNVGTYMVSRTVGKAGLLAQVNRLGFGSYTALRYPGETKGLLKTSKNWVSSDLASLPIGQVDAVPPLQVLDAYNAIANRGVFIQPRLVRAFIDSTGHLVPAPKSATRRALSTGVADTLNAMLQNVVRRGTGVLASVPGYPVAGKTGTSQIPNPSSTGYVTGAYYASFVGFAPANHPVLSMIVEVQRPRTAIFGGAVAAPIFQKVMAYALHHYNIPTTGNIVLPPNASIATLLSDVT